MTTPPSRLGTLLIETLRMRPHWPLATVALIVAADLVLRRDDLPVVVAAALDEPAHLATAGLVLAAMPRSPELRGPDFVNATLIGSVALDLDHLPELLGWSDPAPDRPAPHSALLVALLATLTPALPARWRTTMVGLTSGVAIHLGRDLATGGAPLAAPLTRRIIGVPYPVYAVALAGLARRISRHRSARSCLAASSSVGVE